MRKILPNLLDCIVSNFRSRAALQFEIIALRHQLEVLQRTRPTRVRLTRLDRIFWVFLYRLWPRCLDAVVIVKPIRRISPDQSNGRDCLPCPKPGQGVSGGGPGVAQPGSACVPRHPGARLRAALPLEPAHAARRNHVGFRWLFRPQAVGPPGLTRSAMERHLP